MKTIKLFLLTLLLFQFYQGSGQQFWLTTNEFWGGPKTGITLSNDSVILVSTRNSVLRSTDECYSLEKGLDCSELFTVYASNKGRIFAGGKGKIFFSDDTGITWDSVAINSIYPVTQLTENSYGELFAITGIEEKGDGIFFSGNNGASWSKRNNGLNSNPGCTKVAVDKNDRVYLITSDINSTGAGGLFISETSGLLWQKVTINVDDLASPIKIVKATGLSILSNDSIYMSFNGTASNFWVGLNLSKSINDVSNASFWKVMIMGEHAHWWEDDPINNRYISKNGDWYSSINGYINVGGTCFSKDGSNWEILDYGLGTDTLNVRTEQFFVETSEGRIFMIQKYDERIYTTDKSLVTGIPGPVENKSEVSVFPNPVLRGEQLTIKLDGYRGVPEISIYDITGRKMYSGQVLTSENRIVAPAKSGIYFVQVKSAQSEQTIKVLVQ
ncbi:T9SS type A sorting domain-containing protein [Maribellus sp. CM-23]|uniref:T9SS type A sorting domain-containing protein n=1 Tax=Maribellus sp. CM-23 TaxID=2781026 RepID=UPI001F4411E3|nr:T9SS type A sorting domain-containing protein [Maribellus sp. CM-23]MCE4565679.1 T9SS type A sorting domain-containing protein [Maribellus sp. CM-23]